MNVRLSLKVAKLKKTFINILQRASWVPFLYFAKYNSTSSLIDITCCQVWHIGRCSKCAAKPKSEVFLSHVLAVLRHLRIRHPHVQPVMWDDMLRTISQSDIEGNAFLRFIRGSQLTVYIPVTLQRYHFLVMLPKPLFLSPILHGARYPRCDEFVAYGKQSMRWIREIMS